MTEIPLNDQVSDLRASLSALSAPIDNGNPYIFCDYVGERGCIRGAGHNGPHAFVSGPCPQVPIMLQGALRAAEASPPLVHDTIACPYCNPNSESLSKQTPQASVDAIAEHRAALRPAEDVAYYERIEGLLRDICWHVETEANIRIARELLEARANRAASLPQPEKQIEDVTDVDITEQGPKQ